MFSWFGGGELLVIIVLALLLVGPERLPEFAEQLKGWVRQAREMATNAKGELKEQLGPEFDDVDWRQFDPRQYDPRRIVREALMEAPEGTGATALSVLEPGLSDGEPYALAAAGPRVWNPAMPTPWDVDAT